MIDAQVAHAPRTVRTRQRSHRKVSLPGFHGYRPAYRLPDLPGRLALAISSAATLNWKHNQVSPKEKIMNMKKLVVAMTFASLLVCAAFAQGAQSGAQKAALAPDAKESKAKGKGKKSKAKKDEADDDESKGKSKGKSKAEESEAAPADISEAPPAKESPAATSETANAEGKSKGKAKSKKKAKEGEAASDEKSAEENKSKDKGSKSKDKKKSKGY